MPVDGWIMVCALSAGSAVWLIMAEPIASIRLSALSSCHHAHADPWEPTHTLVVQLLIAALQQGASIPHALRTVGECCPHTQVTQLIAVADALVQGVPWDDAWLVGSAQTTDTNDADNGADPNSQSLLPILAQALRSTWQEGTSAIQQLQAASEQFAIAERAHIEQTAASLSVRLLLPTGLCFLPALLCIGVIPTIMSFLQQ